MLQQSVKMPNLPEFSMDRRRAKAICSSSVMVLKSQLGVATDDGASPPEVVDTAKAFSNIASSVDAGTRKKKNKTC
jgi:hypothetical protein